MAVQDATAVASAVDTLLEAARMVRQPSTPGVVSAIAAAAGLLYVMYEADTIHTVGGSLADAPALKADLEAAVRAARGLSATPDRNFGGDTGVLDGTTDDVLQVGFVFEVTDDTDTTDGVLATAKGTAPAAGDRFLVTAVDTFAVDFIGDGSPSGSESLDPAE